MIRREELVPHIDIKQSFNQQKEFESDTKNHWLINMMIFKEDSRVTVWWNFLFVFASVFSSYFYTYIMTLGEA